MDSLLAEFINTPSDFSDIVVQPMMKDGLVDLGKEINPSKILMRPDGVVKPYVKPASNGFDFNADTKEVDPSSLLNKPAPVVAPPKTTVDFTQPKTFTKVEKPVVTLPKFKAEELPGQIFVGDCIESMMRFPDESIDCVCTSPPYFRLRDYGHDGQIGLEDSPDQYIGKMMLLFDEIKRALKPMGTVWVNLGDSYSGKSVSSDNKSQNIHIPGQSNKVAQYNGTDIANYNLIGIPWRFALAMQSRGWILRQDIIWAKRNCIPESIQDRFCKSHEHIFFFVKNRPYYFDYKKAQEDAIDLIGTKRLKRDVWFVTTNASKGQEGHVAPYPERLLISCMEPGCPEGGLVLDPFMGSGTTGAVAQKLGRKWVGCELNEKWAEQAKKRINDSAYGLF